MSEHKVKLGFDEVRNELHAIAKTGSSIKANDLKFTLEKESLKKFQEEIVALRNGDVNGNFAPRDISYNECSQAYFGVSFETINRALGIKNKSQSFRQAGEMFGMSIGSFGDLLEITKKYSENSLFSSAAPMGTTAIDSSLTWIIPETILQYIKLGIDSVAKSKDWIAATTPVRTQISVQPYIKPADANPKVIAEGERIPVGSVEFGQRTVTVYKIGTGIKMTSELQADSSIDIVSIFFKEVGNNIARNLDRAAYLTIVNGDQADNSGAAPVIGVATAGTLLTTDIDTVMTRMSLAYQKPSVLLMGETMFNLDLNASIPTRELLKIAKYAEGAKSDLLPYVPANQIAMLHKEKCLIELQYRSMIMESKYDEATQTTTYYASRYVGHQKLKDDSAVVLDKSLSISTNNFPANMDYAALYNGFVTK